MASTGCEGKNKTRVRARDRSDHATMILVANTGAVGGQGRGGEGREGRGGEGRGGEGGEGYRQEGRT
jgi:hypothetical protein